MINNVSIKPGCIACGTCERICPKIFHVTKTSEVISRDFDSQKRLIFEAARNCPVSVIAVESDEFELKPTVMKGVFESLEPLNPHVWRLRVKVDPTEFIYTPGQYVRFRMKDKKGSFARCYSVVSYKDGVAEFCVKFSPESRSHAWLALKKRGAVIEATPPRGHFKLKPTAHPKILIATSTGIAPMISMLEERVAGSEKARVTVLMGVRDESEIFYLERLEAIPNIKIIYTLSQPGEDWKGSRGRVTEQLSGLQLTPETEIYLCGNPKMVDQVRADCAARGQPDEKIFWEGFVDQDTNEPPRSWLVRFFLDGEVPYLPWLSKALFAAAFLSPLLLLPGLALEFTEFSSVGWTVLFGVMLVRPLADVFPDLGILRTLVSLRREFGVLTGFLLFDHLLGFFIASGLPVSSLWTDPTFSDPKSFLFWGLVGILALIPLVITSNDLSMRILKRGWKRLHRLAYLLFLAGAVHVYLVGEETGLIYGAIVAVFWLLAGLKVKFNLSSRAPYG
ncbi:hypothetical protein CO046_04135 [Candidatus Peregrinibacteria bacterium CG_4_9_14_0_2_um_filter_53_11]|nr:MAG: hypothetical protein CO046_04135 [Candidatus Peregrinibacteria bacterium CG_4_9_14_0_2_um_filter_53_11]